MAGLPMQIMMLAFMAGAGISNMAQSLGKMKDLISGKPAAGAKGAKADAAASGGMSIPPQVAQMLASNPSMAARLMAMVKQQMQGGGAPPAAGGMM